MKSSNDLPHETKQDSFKYTIQVLKRALELFEVIARSDAPLTIQELQNATGLNRTTIWRILSTMMECDFITQFSNTKQYALSCKAYNLVLHASSKSLALLEAAKPEMERLREFSGESVLLLVPEIGGSRTIYQLDSHESIRLKDYSGEVTPLFGTSTGIVQLSSFSDEEVEALFPDALPAYTDQTPTDREEVLRRVRACREDGYTFIVDEFNTGDTGLSAPIYVMDQLVGILNVSGPTSRFGKRKMNACLPALRDAVASIQRTLSHR